MTTQAATPPGPLLVSRRPRTLLLQIVICYPYAVIVGLQIRREKALILSNGNKVIDESRSMNVKDKVTKPQIWDTAGEESGMGPDFQSQFIDIRCPSFASRVGGTIVRVGGMAKGSLIIHPNMATTLCVPVRGRIGTFCRCVEACCGEERRYGLALMLRS
ncbi:ArgJ-like domain protein [Raphanus sativus]|nr:ArgJ-like domain protein [Raphanus sativus]KAJ4881810.1 ArgJ-like domain protein [Raphanus sativus]